MSCRRTRALLIFTTLLGGAALLGGCQALSNSPAPECSLSSVPMLIEDRCLVQHWIAFAEQSQQADDAWRSTIAQRLASTTARDRLVRAVAFSWSSEPARLLEAQQLYAEAMEQAPPSLRPLLQLWQADIAQRREIVRPPHPVARTAAAPRESATRIASLEQENAELKRKIEALADIEAVMDRRSGQ